MICEAWDVAVVPFPFAERAGTKRRPALVIRTRRFNEAGHTILAMITSQMHAAWHGDADITEARAAGLHAACIVRLKLFTLDNRLIAKRIGALGSADRETVLENLRRYVV